MRNFIIVFGLVMIILLMIRGIARLEQRQSVSNDVYTGSVLYVKDENTGYCYVELNEKCMAIIECMYMPAGHVTYIRKFGQ